jgi:rod shape-determining protein MreD
MAELLNYPILILLLILQMTIGRNIQLLGGTADLVLIWLVCWGLQKQGKNVWFGAIFAGLLFSFASAIPWYASFIAFFTAAAFSRYFSRRFWHNPLIALFIVSFFCAVIQNLVTFAALKVSGGTLDWGVSLTHIMVPSIFLDLLIALPIYAIVRDMAKWVYPVEVES